MLCIKIADIRQNNKLLNNYAKISLRVTNLKCKHIGTQKEVTIINDNKFETIKKLIDFQRE